MEQKLNQLKYNNVRLKILDYIVSHGLRIDERLPPERVFAHDLGCSVGTMRIALKALEDNGLIEKRHGMGNYLRRTVADMPPVGKILYVSVVCDRSMALYPPSELTCYCASKGLRLECKSIVEFADLSLDSLSDCLGILLTGWITDEIVQNFLALQIPIIVLGNRRSSLPVPVVSNDICKASYRLTREFIKRGKSRIGFWDGEEDYVTLCDAKAGYIAAMEESGFDWRPWVMEWDDEPPCVRVGHYLHRHPELEVFISEMLAFNEFSQAFAADRTLAYPDFGIIPLLPRGYYWQSEHMLFADCKSNHVLVAAEQLYQAIACGAAMHSVVVEPVLHGIDDEITAF